LKVVRYDFLFAGMFVSYRKFFNSFSNTGEINRRVIIAIIGICALIQTLWYGTHAWQVILYNIAVPESAGNLIPQISPFGYAISRYSFVSNFFEKTFVYFLRAPFPELIMGWVMKFSFGIFVFFLCKRWEISDHLAFIAAVVFFLPAGYVSHGLTFNGMWREALFFKASLGAFFILLSWIFYYRKSFWVAGFFSALSIALHPGYGLSAFAFIYAGYSIYKLFRKEFEILKLLIPALVTVLYFAIIGTFASAEAPRLPVNFNQWFTYLKQTDPDDVLLMYTLKNFGYLIAPLAVIVIVYRERIQSEELKILFWGATFLTVILVGFEALHSRGFSLPVISEQITALQLRRGIWVYYLIVLAVILHLISLFKKSLGKGGEFILPLFCIAFLNPVPLVLVAAAGITGVIVFLNGTKFTRKELILLLTLPVSFYLTFADIRNANSWVIGEYVKAAVVTSVILLLVTYLFLRNRQYRHELLALVVILGWILSWSRVYYPFNNVKTSLKQINAGNYWKIPEGKKAALDFITRRGGVSAELLKDINEVNREHEIIQLPPGLYNSGTYLESYITGNRIFLSLDDWGTVLFSKKSFENYLYKLSLVCGTDNPLSLYENEFGKLNPKVFDAYDSLTPIQIENIFNKAHVRYLVTYTRYDNLVLSRHNHNYFIYDLKKTFQKK